MVPLEAITCSRAVLLGLVERDLGAEPLGALVRLHIAQLAIVRELDADLLVDLVRPSLDLMQALVTRAARLQRSEDVGPDSALGVRIVAFMTGHLADPSLSPARVAKHFAISKRHLYVLLAREGVSFAHWVRSRRLEMARDLLADPTGVNDPVSTIDKAAGFRDHSTFSRSFKATFSTTPRDWRASQR